jgi:hypothetical protein
VTCHVLSKTTTHNQRKNNCSSGRCSQSVDIHLADYNDCQVCGEFDLKADDKPCARCKTAPRDGKTYCRECFNAVQFESMQRRFPCEDDRRKYYRERYKRWAEKKKAEQEQINPKKIEKQPLSKSDKLFKDLLSRGLERLKNENKKAPKVRALRPESVAV